MLIHDQIFATAESLASQGYPEQAFGVVTTWTRKRPMILQDHAWVRFVNRNWWWLEPVVKGPRFPWEELHKEPGRVPWPVY
jgi:hypothetical protein